MAADMMPQQKWSMARRNVFGRGGLNRMAYLAIGLAAIAPLGHAQQPPARPALLKGHTHSVSSAGFTTNGKIVVTGSFDNSIKLWDTATGRELRTLTGHQGQVLSLDVSRDGANIVSGSRDNTLK